MSRKTIVEQVLNEALRQSPEDRIPFIADQEQLPENVREELIDLLSYHDTRDGSVDSTEPSVDELWFGKPTIPGYRLGGIIGTGGMGRVYEARQATPSRLVAIKCLKPELASDSKARARFRREADLMAGLDHPGIVKVFDHIELSETCCIVMQYVSGPRLERPLSLGQLIARKSSGLSPAEVKSVMLQLTDALAYAHAKGVIHRDIKPSNILIDQQGRVRITDFGIALASVLGAPSLTSKFSVLGTYDYMSPEQHSGDAIIDEKSDIYSLGVVMYQLLTGVIPRGRCQLPGQIRNDQFDGFDSCFQRACSPEPIKRYASMEEFRAAIKSIVIDAANTKAENPSIAEEQSSKSLVITKSRVYAICVLLGVTAFAIGWVSITKNWTGEDRQASSSEERDRPIAEQSESFGTESRSFNEDFNRLDTFPDNDWVEFTSSGGMTIRDGRLVVPNQKHGAAIYRLWTCGEHTRVTVDVIGTVDGQNATDRYGHTVFFSNAPGVKSGYGISLSRTSRRFQNSSISVFGLRGTIKTLTPPFQWEGQLTVDFYFNTANGVIGGIVTDQSSQTYEFKVDVGEVKSSFNFFGLQMGAPGRVTDDLPAFDDLRLRSTEIQPEPSFDTMMRSGRE